MAQVFDIAVLGATAAGYVAATALSKKGRSVVLIESPHPAAECPLWDWVPHDFFTTAGLAKTLAKTVGAAPFAHVFYHNADLAKSAEHKARSPLGSFVETRKLLDVLRKEAAKSGVKIKSSHTRPAIRLEEDVTRVLGSSPVNARLLLISDDHPNDVIADLSLPMHTVVQAPMVAAALEIPLAAPHRKSLAGMLHVVETRDRSDLGLFYLAGDHLHIRLISASAASGTRAEELSTLVTRLQRGGVLPVELPLAKARGAVWHPPAGMALEMETHVAKRCMLIGAAGGFAESITGQTLFPGVRSAVMAADIAQAALGQSNPQEEVMRFKNAWRKTLADYLRPPNTSLQMLLPLLFVNRQIVAKFTRALLLGEII